MIAPSDSHQDDGPSSRRGRSPEADAAGSAIEGWPGPPARDHASLSFPSERRLAVGVDLAVHAHETGVADFPGVVAERNRPQVPVEYAERRQVDAGDRISTRPSLHRTHLMWLHGTSGMDDRRAADFVLRVPSIAVPARAFGSGWLDLIGGVGPHVIPLKIAQPIKDAIAAGETVICWISGEQILLGRLHLDHVIPYSYGGATNLANLLPADAVANMSRGNSLDVLRDRKIGWKWDLDRNGRRVRVPDGSQRLVRVVTADGEAVYWSVPKFNVGEFAVGAAGSAGIAVALGGAMQWRAGEFRPDDLAEEAAKAAAGYSARYSAKVAVKSLAPRAISLVGPAGVERLGAFAGPIGLVAAIYGAEAIEQGVALARGKVTPAKAARSFALAPIGAVKDTADLAVYGYKLVSPRHRAIRKNQRKWRSINFIPDLKRSGGCPAGRGT
jgi:hypothetical protein